jgi:hypothetical protein
MPSNHRAPCAPWPPAKHGSVRVERRKQHWFYPPNAQSSVNRYILNRCLHAHCVILVLGRQTSVSPAPSDFIETWKNHCKDIRCNRTDFSCHFIIPCMKNKLNLTTLYTIHTRALRSRRLFHCAPKTLWQRPGIKFWEGNECGWWCMVDILIPIHIARCAHANVCAGIRVTIENRSSIYQ